MVSQIGQPWESLAIIRADGTGYTRITDASIQHRRVEWQPVAGSERILFSSNVTPMTIQSDGSGRTPIDELALFEGFWSQDGRHVLTNDVRANWNIEDFCKYELQADGSFRRLDWSVELDEKLGPVYLEAWSSADDLALLWGPRGSPSQGLHLIDLETSAVRRLYGAPTVFRSGVFLPGGKRILFRRANEILLVDSETGELRSVFEVEQDTSGALAKGIALSRDGRQLAILAKRDEGDVWVMDLEPAAPPR